MSVTCSLDADTIMKHVTFMQCYLYGVNMTICKSRGLFPVCLHWFTSCMKNTTDVGSADVDLTGCEVFKWTAGRAVTVMHMKHRQHVRALTAYISPVKSVQWSRLLPLKKEMHPATCGKVTAGAADK